MRGDQSRGRGRKDTLKLLTSFGMDGCEGADGVSHGGRGGLFRIGRYLFRIGRRGARRCPLPVVSRLMTASVGTSVAPGWIVVAPHLASWHFASVGCDLLFKLVVPNITQPYQCFLSILKFYEI